MDRDDQKGPGTPSRADVEQSKKRDDTPSFVRDVEARAELLNPDRGIREHLPVLTMPRSVRIWRAIRWPLLVVVVVFVLATVGFVTHDLLVSQSVKRTIADSQKTENKGQIRELNLLTGILFALAERNPTRPNAQASFAWQAVLQSVLLGPEKEWKEKAQIALRRGADEDTSAAWAAKAGVAYLSGDYKQALALVDKGLQSHKGDARLELVRAWALIGLGRADDARRALDAAIPVSGDYVPLLIARTELDLDAGKRLEAATQAEKLLAAAPGHLYGLLVAIALYLPDWGGAPISPDLAARLLSEIEKEESEIAAAPPKIAHFGYYLKARVNLLAGRFKEAVASFSKVAESDQKPEVIAWYAKALLSLEGPAPALALLEKYPASSGPEIYDIRAQCLLAFDRVDAAGEVVRKLKETGALADRVRDLSWLLEIYRGDSAAALESMPKKITAADQLPALELYELLRRQGDGAAIEKLVKAFGAELGACQKAILAWHGGSSERAFQSLDNLGPGKPTCLYLLAIRFLRGHVPPDKLGGAMKRLGEPGTVALSFRVDLALATWLVEGYAEASKMLDSIWNARPEGAPVLLALARAYMAMELPEKALEVLKGRSDPESLALQVLAARGAGKKDVASEMLSAALATGSERPAPAVAFLSIKDAFKSGKIFDAADAVKEVLPRAGEWTSEIAEYGALAYDSLNKNTDADKLLYQVSKQVAAGSGTGESLDTRLAQIDLNLRRGRKFKFRALYLLNSLKDEGIRDPRLFYGLAMLNIDEDNDRMGIRLLRDALSVDPTFKPAYVELAKLGRLDAEAERAMKKAWPGFVLPAK